MMTSRTNQHNLWITLVMSCWLSWSAVAGELSDFSCLAAIIPATDSYWIKTHRADYSIPQVSPAGTMIVIPHWKNDRLVDVFVYTEKSMRRFDRVRAFAAPDTEASSWESGGSAERPLSSLDKVWLRSYTLAVKSEALEVFRVTMEPPGGWDRGHRPRGAMSALAALATAGSSVSGGGAVSSTSTAMGVVDAPREPVSSMELGGWLVEAEKPGDVRLPIKKEIELRKRFAQENNLNTDRFKAWLRADEVCAGDTSMKKAN